MTTEIENPTIPIYSTRSNDAMPALGGHLNVRMPSNSRQLRHLRCRRGTGVGRSGSVWSIGGGNRLAQSNKRPVARRAQ